ncbi:MAG: nucleotidyltransferase domain-containing protein [Bacilli bacterium]|nr:nucleotidyltransferase domain-containing protein [Bacilli bacterium]
MTLKEARTEYVLSQREAAGILCIPERTFRRYELDEHYGSDIKRRMFLRLLDEACEVTEEKGMLTLEKIKERCATLFDRDYKGVIDFCYLFGSYAKGTAKGDSDVDLYVSSSLTGLAFVGLVEKLRQTLHKKVDLIRGSKLNNNVALVNEIMKYGVKIYG